MSFALDPIPRARFDRNAIELPRYADIEARFNARLQGLIDGYRTGALKRADMHRAFARELLHAQNEAYISGRRVRGIASGEITPAELATLRARAQHQATYWRQFVWDVDNGRGKMPATARAKLYAKSLWSVYLRGEAGSDPNARYYWIVDVDAEHCPDCLRKVKQSRQSDGFSFEELTVLGWPGDGIDKCRTNCRCHIRVKRSAPPGGPAAVEAPDAIEELVSQLRVAHPDVVPATREGLRVLYSHAGPALVDPLPASGLPGVRVPPAFVYDPRRLATFGPMLGLLPLLLAYPAVIYDGEGEGPRTYEGYGVKALVSQDPYGAWWLADLRTKS